MKKYYNQKRFKELDLKKGSKVWLLYKNFKLRQLSKKLDHVKLRPFKIIVKISKVMYKLDLLKKIKIYLVQYIIILKPTYKDLELLVYKIDIYRGQEKDEQLIKKIINYKEINNKMWFKVLQESYKEIIQELKENLKNTKDKIKVY